MTSSSHAPGIVHLSSIVEGRLVAACDYRISAADKLTAYGRLVTCATCRGWKPKKRRVRRARGEG